MQLFLRNALKMQSVLIVLSVLSFQVVSGAGTSFFVNGLNRSMLLLYTKKYYLYLYEV